VAAAVLVLWDIIGKACGHPVYKLWGAARDQVPAYASCIQVRKPSQRAEDMLRAQAAGWRATKLRIHERTLAADVAQVEAVRRAVGDDFTLLVDANQAQQPGTLQPEEGPVWSHERASQTARELQRLGVYWLEELLGRYDFDNLARLDENVGRSNRHGGRARRSMICSGSRAGPSRRSLRGIGTRICCASAWSLVLRPSLH
jgi:L-alanine-DL-glutamate epimerase-like enolase superfamily enzyme